MVCDKCGFILMTDAKFCDKCGNQITSNNVNINNNHANNINSNMTNATNDIISNDTSNKKNLLLIGIGLILVLIVAIVIIIMNSKNKRSEVLTNIEHNNYLKFTIDEQEFYIGDKISEFQKKDYSYDEKYITEEDYIIKDSIMMQTFYKDETPKFLGALYCDNKENCKYKDTTVVKINFYEDSDVVVNDFIKVGLSYDEIVEKYGKEDGKFYQNEDMLVWTFGEKGKIGEPYYILRFDTGGWFSSEELIDIRIGVWWYEGEYEHTVIKDKNIGGEKNEKQ